MNKWLSKNQGARLLALSFVVVSLLGACSKPVDPVVVAIPAQYALSDVRYFFSAGDRIDTVTLQLKGASVQNPGSTTVTQQVKEDLSELIKTSRFTIASATQLPTDIDLSKFEVRVPQQWYGNSSLVQSIETYSLSPSQQQKPYVPEREAASTITVAPKSRIDISRQIDAYQLTCSFDCLLENKTTGQRYPITGKWQGLLQYNNLSVTLKESAL
ncbi:hypothetical protein FAES_0189 [Fibrella aestuarina BUZ 2]|uniref:Lipoprotein n=1 Tax=Fibrella aestuarina BUZ 2 TaxID=1166018 RepID=I0K250_9BACT|nr:hypothetical protein [Fibrella aestuarina]CCG98203.1 hypothetical protein FAES_0189 [Fibrella aestuarina BUZ 2]